MLLFRADYGNMQQSSKEEWQAVAKKWKDWTDGISAQGKWGSSGMQLSPEGKVVKSDRVITDGPYTEIKEMIVSFCTIKAESKEEAAEISKGCPILESGGSVEVREIVRK